MNAQINKEIKDVMKSITFDDFSRKTYAKMKIVACKYMDSDCKGSDQGGNDYLKKLMTRLILREGKKFKTKPYDRPLQTYGKLRSLDMVNAKFLTQILTRKPLKQ